MSQVENALIISISGPLINKIKCSMLYALKNKNLGQGLMTTICLLGEQLLPKYCSHNRDNHEKINTIHNLVFLLAHKAQQVFTSHIIHTAIDQNWDMKGLKQVLVRIFKELGVTGYDGVTALLDTQIKNQNLQSSSCIKAIGSFVRNPKKNINADDLANSISTYETSYEFIKEDIEKYRVQRIKHECFSVLHPWAYDLDLVDFKYIINNDITPKVVKALKSQEAQVFWLSNFKCQASVSSDDFFGALNEIAQINRIPASYQNRLAEYLSISHQENFVISLSVHAGEIDRLVRELVKDAANTGFNALRDQLKSYTTPFAGSELIKGVPAGFQVESNPRLGAFSSLAVLGDCRMRESTPAELSQFVDLQRRPFQSVPNQAATHKLHLNFEAVDTEEIKNLAISFDGSLGVFKIGEGDSNHYQIPNDKKLWESQLMIVCKNGKYFIRDLGIVHTSRIKIDKMTEVQIQQDMLVDLGKVVHYHFDKVTHRQTPSTNATQYFQILYPSAISNYIIEDAESNEPPVLRARPTWVSSDENKDLIQKEIILEALNQQQFTIGRSMKREVQIKLKAVSADHCQIGYSNDKGWTISEKNKDKLSSNGTFVFMKSHSQMIEHEPSDLIPLHDGMVISFINYEIRVNLEKKDASVISSEEQQFSQFNQNIQKSSTQFQTTVKAQAPAAVEEFKAEVAKPVVVEHKQPEPVQVAKVDVNDQHGADLHEVEKDAEPLAEESIHHEDANIQILNDSKEDEHHYQQHQEEMANEQQINIVEEHPHVEAVQEIAQVEIESEIVEEHKPVEAVVHEAPEQLEVHSEPVNVALEIAEVHHQPAHEEVKVEVPAEVHHEPVVPHIVAPVVEAGHVIENLPREEPVNIAEEVHIVDSVPHVEVKPVEHEQSPVLHAVLIEEAPKQEAPVEILKDIHVDEPVQQNVAPEVHVEHQAPEHVAVPEEKVPELVHEEHHAEAAHEEAKQIEHVQEHSHEEEPVHLEEVVHHDQPKAEPHVAPAEVHHEAVVAQEEESKLVKADEAEAPAHVAPVQGHVKHVEVINTKALAHVDHVEAPAKPVDHVEVPAKPVDHVEVPAKPVDHVEAPAKHVDHVEVPAKHVDHAEVPAKHVDHAEIPAKHEDHVEIPAKVADAALHASPEKVHAEAHSVVVAEVPAPVKPKVSAEPVSEEKKQ